MALKPTDVDNFIRPPDYNLHAKTPWRARRPFIHHGKVYQQLKTITGEAIYLAQEHPNCGEFKVAFSQYVDNYRFYTPWKLENIAEVLDNHPSWLKFLLDHEFMRSEEDLNPKNIKVTDVVTITDAGHMYTTYTKLAEELDAVRYVTGSKQVSVYKGQRGRVVAVREHDRMANACIALVDIMDEEILIDVRGLTQFECRRY